MEDDWPSTFKIIKDTHDRIYETIDVAIKNEEHENPQLSIINYKLSVVIIDEALAIPVGVPDDPTELDETWQQACKMIHKIKRTRAEVVQRISTLTIKYPSPTEETPAFDELASEATNSDKRPRTYAELAIALNNMEHSENAKPDTLQLIFVCDSVKFYHIGIDGKVTTNSENSILRILSLDEDEAKHLQATFFLQITSQALVEDNSQGESTSNAISDEFNSDKLISDDTPWIYPLVAGASPCFYTEFGAFIFPDVNADEPGAAVGIVVPHDSEHIILEIFEAILHGVIRQSTTDDTQRSRRSTSENISGNIIKGAHYVSKGLVYGSTKVGQFVTHSTPYIISKMERVPENTPPVSDKVISGVNMAKTATHVAVNVTGYVAGKVGSATMALGRFLAPHVQTQGSRLLSHTMGYSQEDATDTVIQRIYFFYIIFYLSHSNYR